MIALVALMGAILYRVRGGGFVSLPGTQMARMVWCLPTGILCGLLAGGEPGVTALCAAAAFLGLLIPHGWAQNGDLTGLFGMSAVTLGRVAVLVFPVWFFAGALWGPSFVLASLAGPAYWLGYRLPRLGDGSGLNGGTEIGEFLTGGLLWSGLVLGPHVG